jgi:hypothetical protein
LKTYATIIAKTARTVKACMQKNKGNTEIKYSIKTGGNTEIAFCGKIFLLMV